MFMNSENGKTSTSEHIAQSYRQNRLEKKKINILLYQVLVFTIHGKI